jgi:hypothetical protein
MDQFQTKITRAFRDNNRKLDHLQNDINNIKNQMSRVEKKICGVEFQQTDEVLDVTAEVNDENLKKAAQ